MNGASAFARDITEKTDIELQNYVLGSIQGVITLYEGTPEQKLRRILLMTEEWGRELDRRTHGLSLEDALRLSIEANKNRQLNARVGPVNLRGIKPSAAKGGTV